MIDYNKTKLLSIDTEILLNKITFGIEVSEEDSEILSSCKVAKYHFCEIIIYDSGTTVLTGSLHKMYNSLKGIQAPRYIAELKKLQTQYIKDRNDKTLKKIETLKEKYNGYNGNQFTLKNFIEVREHLQKLFNCTPQQMVFQNVEFGINTTPKFNPQLFIKGLLYHYGKPFEFRFRRRYAQVEHQRYYIKIYNKSNQYGIKTHTLRVELKLTRTDQFTPLGIRTFADINSLTLNKAKDLILKRFDEVVYYDDTIQKENLSERQNQTLEKYSNPRYWVDTLKKQNRCKHRKNLQNYILNYSSNLHQKIREEIERKSVPITKGFKGKKKQKKCTNYQRFKKQKSVPITNSSKLVNGTPPSPQKSIIKKCSVTGINLTLEKEGSLYIKTTTLKHLKNNDKKEFERLVISLLKNSGVAPKFERNIFSRLAKQVRNRHYNSFKIKQVGYNKKIYNNSNQLEIFNFSLEGGGSQKPPTPLT